VGHHPISPEGFLFLAQNWPFYHLPLNFAARPPLHTGLVPMPEGMKLPFPALTQALEPVCQWCGKNPEWVFGIGTVLLFPGLMMKINYSRYYMTLALAVTMTLGLTWYLISAPVDRLIKNVEDNIPRDHRVSDPLKH
jgi:hypothetical protein